MKATSIQIADWQKRYAKLKNEALDGNPSNTRLNQMAHEEADLANEVQRYGLTMNQLLHKEQCGPRSKEKRIFAITLNAKEREQIIFALDYLEMQFRGAANDIRRTGRSRFSGSLDDAVTGTRITHNLKRRVYNTRSQ